MSFLDELNEISKTPEEAATEKYQDDYQYGMKFAEYDFMEVKSDIKLVTTENFGNLESNFYRNMNDDILLTREQIGQALEYSNPSTAIKNLHRKHKDRLDLFSVRIKLGGIQNEPTSKSEEQERVYYTQRGIMEICRWSRQPLANKFMDWV